MSKPKKLVIMQLSSIWIVLVGLISMASALRDRRLLLTEKTKPPENVHVQLRNETTVKIDFDKPTNYSNDEIDFYEVEVRQMLHELISGKIKITKPPVTHVLMSGLRPKVVYNLMVSIHMVDGRNGQSSLLRFSTSSVNASDACLCDPYGSQNLTINRTCTPGVEQCLCRPNYTGSHCSICVSHHYRQEDRPCEKCPCFENSSDGQCSYDPTMNRPVCTNCKTLLRGPLCELCIDGYYKKGKGNTCIPCPCPRNPDGPSRCTMFEGRCLNCPNGTMGDSCEQCLQGWTGTAPHCVPKSPYFHSSVTVIVALVALIAVAVALVLGYWAMRMRARRKRLNAWSLELSRYEREHPGHLVDTASHSGLMMEEAPTAVSTRLQLRQGEGVGEDLHVRVKKGSPLV